MPSVLTGANLANRDLMYLGVSGDGDSASIGIGQFANAMRRGIHMVYIVENNGVYGLTKGQFSATSDKGAKSKRGVVNSDEPIDLVGMALQLGATFVARSFSGDKAQLVPLIEAALEHQGAAFIDCISPCVAFNNHEGSTKSFDYVREHNEAVNSLDIMPPRRRSPSITRPERSSWSRSTTARCCVCASCTATMTCTIGSRALTYMQERHAAGEIVTGLLYVDPNPRDMHAHLKTVETPLNALDDAALVPGAKMLEAINASLR